jgi:rare lipoprotein A
LRKTPILAALLVYVVAGLQIAHAETGVAVYYSNAYQGRRAADGTTFDQAGLTAAHKTLPFGTKVRVTNPRNKQSVVVTITDRMAQYNKNLIDLTVRAARELGIIQQGRAQVTVEVEP